MEFTEPMKDAFLMGAVLPMFAGALGFTVAVAKNLLKQVHRYE